MNTTTLPSMEGIFDNSVIRLNGKGKTVLVGNGQGLKMNASIGLNSSAQLQNELLKINAIAKNKNLPDLMMDLSTTRVQTPLYSLIGDILGCPVGTVPTYLCFNEAKGIEKDAILELIEEQAENGVSFFTLHLTADLKLAEKSLARTIPIISRGGSLLLRDMKMNHRDENILLQNIDEIIKICKNHNMVISVGTTFRPSTLSDAMDEVNVLEMERQKSICNYIIRHGVPVQMEGIGHIPLHRLSEYVALLRNNLYIPFMPLGPIVSDRTAGYDHITAAIGGCAMAMLGGADIINAVTREEHTGGIPTIESIIEAIDTAATAIKIVDDARFFNPDKKPNVQFHNCMGIPDQIGCSRCGIECPFLWNDNQ